MKTILMQNRGFILCSLLVLFQVSLSLHRINAPLVDGRQHIYYENARFLMHSYHSNDDSLEDVRKVFGTSSYGYDSDGKPETIGFYNHHPVALHFLLRLYTRVVGYDDWASSTFALFISIGITVFLFLILLNVTGSPSLSTILTAFFVVMPIYFTYQNVIKYEATAVLFMVCSLYFLVKKSTLRISPLTLNRLKDEGLPKKTLQKLKKLSARQFGSEDDLSKVLAETLDKSQDKQHQASILAGIGREGRDFWGWGFLSVYFLSFHSDWPAYFTSGLVFLYLFWKRNSLPFKGFYLKALVAAVLGIGTNFLILYWLGYGFGMMKQYVFDDFSYWDWLVKMWNLLKYNYTEVNIVLLIGSILFLAGLKRKDLSLLSVFGAIILTTSVLYIVLFKRHATIHSFMQYFFGLSLVFLLGEVLFTLMKWAARQSDSIEKRIKRMIVSSLLLVFFVVFLNSIDRDIKTRQGSLGKGDDIAMIKETKKRLVVFPFNNISGPISWWTSPPIQWYTDRLYRKTRHQGYVILEKDTRLNPDQDLFVSLNNKDLIPRVKEYCRQRFKLRSIEVEKCSSTFCLYRFR
ncbi:MAG: hypothetical protein GY866_12025 [Proteobacteria bacterium]|nr:hypothetical protein [Pseudomonadota bacterium]